MYKYERKVELSADKCFAKISSSLKEYGFVLLSYVDMQEILKKNFSENFLPYYILEVCKPSAAKEMVGIDIEYGLFLPCKIVLAERPSGTKIMMARVSQQSKDYLGADESVAKKYEEELISIIDKI